ncbi:MAG: hypothetical protein K5839_06580 [Treponemataceae bacterium]|nr:hypothetical protein [Treponemataceae bacterium]
MTSNANMILFIIKLVLGGIATFFAILLWAKTRDLAWMFAVIGTIVQYCAIVYNLLCAVGIIPPNFLPLFGIPLFTLIFTVLVPLFFIVAFILMFIRSDKYEI